MTRLGAALFGLIVLAAGPGCVSVVPYTPKTSLIEEMGYKDAQGRFGELMTRARSPRIGDATIDSKKFEFSLVGGHAGGWWWGWGAPGARPVIYHNNIGRLDVYENNKVFVLGPDERKMTEFLFSSQQDCFLFADLVWSFKSYQGPEGAGGGSSGEGSGSGGAGSAPAEPDRNSQNVLEGDQNGSGDGSSDSGDSGGDGDQKQKNVLGDD